MLSWPGLPVGLILTHRISTPRTPKEINPWISAHYGDQSSIPSGTRTPSSASYNTVRNTRVGFSGTSHDREGTGRASPSPTPLARQNCEGTRREAPRLTFPCLSGNLSFYSGFLPCAVAILTAIMKALVSSLVGGSPFIVHHSHSLLFVLLKPLIEKEITESVPSYLYRNAPATFSQDHAASLAPSPATFLADVLPIADHVGYGRALQHVSLLVPGKKYPETGIKNIYGKTPVIVRVGGSRVLARGDG